MATVMRRTPTNEEAMNYGYRNFLRDIVSSVGEGASRNVARLISGEVSDSELLDLALSPQAGMLKIEGAGRLLQGLLEQRRLMPRGAGELAIRVRKGLERGDRAFFEALKIPQSEYSRIERIGWGAARPHRGEFWPGINEIRLNMESAKRTTPWHEFTHARETNPATMSRLPSGKLESTAALQLSKLRKLLAEAGRKIDMTEADFYVNYSPTERHARSVASYAVKHPGDFDSIYKIFLEEEIAKGIKNLNKLRGRK